MGDALLLAGKHNPDLLAEYARVEAEIGRRFRRALALADVLQDVRGGVEPGPVRTWAM